MGYKKTLTPGAIEVEQGTLSDTKEDIRLDQILPAEILENKEKLYKFLQAYYTFMNMDEFIFQETNTFTDVVQNGLAQFRIPDPNNENNKFFTDETGGSSTLILTSPTGTTTNITLTAINVAITNGNELPGTLATSTSEIGKTFTVNGLDSFNNHTARLTTIQKNWVGPGPSYVMNTIESAMDIDTNEDGYLELMQKEIAATVPRGITVNKRILYKQIIDFYRLRGSSDSIEIFFKILFDDFAEVEFPFDKVLVPSSGNWDINPSLSRGGQYLDNKGFLSDSIKIHDSLKFQKFSYLIKTGKNISDWELSFDRLVHPAGFIYFAEILIFLQLTKAVLGEDELDLDQIRNDGLPLNIRKVLSAIPTRQPGIVGPEDIPVLIEMFVSTFLPQTQAKIHKSGTVSLTLKNGIINAITITNAGSGYLTAPTTANNKITTSDSAGASGHTKATITAALTNGSVSSTTIVNGGRDYGIPVITFAAPAPITFDGSDDEVSGTGIVNLTDNTIKLTSAQQAALPVDAIVTYSGPSGAINGLVSGQQYKIHTSANNKVKLKSMTGSSVIDITGVGTGTNHSFTGVTATATATVLDGALKSIEVVEPGFGYASAPAITFSGVPVSGLSGVAPNVSIGIDSNGRLDRDNITINSEGSNWSNLFGSVAANANASKIAEITLVGKANKIYKTAPTIVFPEPQSRDADGNLLSSNVTATAAFSIHPDGHEQAGEIVNTVLTVANGGITNAGNGYVDDPTISIGSGANNELRANSQYILDLSLNHVMTNRLNGFNFDNFRTIINNNYIQRKGTDNFFTTPRLYNTNRTIESLGSKTLQTIDSSDINNNNTSTFVHIE